MDLCQSRIHEALAFLLVLLFGELDDEDRRLGRECYDQHHPDLRVDVVLHRLDQGFGNGHGPRTGRHSPRRIAVGVLRPAPPRLVLARLVGLTARQFGTQVPEFGRQRFIVRQLGRLRFIEDLEVLGGDTAETSIGGEARERTWQ